jgi:hypothetical protein
MKREFFGGAIFFSFLVGINYILKNMYERYSDDDSENADLSNVENKSDTTNETVTNETVTNETVTNETVTNEFVTNEFVTNELVTNELVTNELVMEEINNFDNDTCDNCSHVDVLDSVIKIVLDTKIEDDIEMIQKVLDRKQYLLGLNDRLSEIRERLEDLKNELMTKN